MNKGLVIGFGLLGIITFVIGYADIMIVSSIDCTKADENGFIGEDITGKGITCDDYINLKNNEMYFSFGVTGFSIIMMNISLTIPQSGHGTD